MKDQLDDFVKNNREAFDDKDPSGKVWKGVEAGMNFNNVTLWNSVAIWRAAAVVFMVATASLLVYNNIKSSKNADALAANTAAVSDFADVEEYYFQEISEKTALIEESMKGEGLNGFTHDFQQLEAMYNVLKEEMKTRPSKKVKDALVLNLLVRIDLLNQQLHKLENGEEEHGGEETGKKGKASV